MTFENVVIIEGHEENIKVHQDNLFCGPMRIGDIEIFEHKLIISGIPHVLAQVETVTPRETIKGTAMMYKKGYCIFVDPVNLQSGINMKRTYIPSYYEEYASGLDKHFKIWYNKLC